MPDKIDVLVVDDSSLMRVMISNIIDEQNDMRVVGTASNGKEAMDKVTETRPGVVLLDLVMDDYDGVYAIKEIMRNKPTPIIVLSSLGNTEPERMFEAIDLGAYEFVDKPKATLAPKIRDVSAELLLKIRQAANVDTRMLTRMNKRKLQLPHTFAADAPYHILTIGASTGGTKAIEELLGKLPENFPLPVVIAQHIPQEFVFSLAARLNAIGPLPVKVAAEGELIKNGVVYIAPATANMQIVNKAGKYVVAFTQQKYGEFDYPSVDCLFESIANAFGAKSLAVILTGMGKDGAKGMKKIAEKGGFTIAQDQESCVVFGMPQAAINLGAAKRVVNLSEMSSFIVKCL